MKQLITIILLSILASVSFQSTSFADQTPANTQCSDKSALRWTMNIEPDVKEYKVYAANNPIDPLVDNTTLILMTVPHPTSGTDVTTTLNTTLADGDKYFRVTASDDAGNERVPG